MNIWISNIQNSGFQRGNLDLFIPEKSVIIAIASHESDYGNSEIARRNKNLFGLKRKGKYIKFLSYEKSIIFLFGI
jgi:uncharacterized FlgJ-related protein